MKYILGAFDGTGSKEWMWPNGMNSHTYMFYANFDTDQSLKFYAHGPGTLGSESKEIAEKGIENILNSARKTLPPSSQTLTKTGYKSLDLSAVKNIRICLVGHSRGGLIATWIANELSRYGLPVYFLGLYDAVDRAKNLNSFDPPEGSEFRLGIRSDSVSNAHYTYHAIRDPKMKSRPTFGNTSRAPLDPTYLYKERLFMTSHGGIGGDPFPTKRHLKIFGRKKEYYDLSADLSCVDDKGNLRKKACNDPSMQAGQWITQNARDLGIPVL